MFAEGHDDRPGERGGDTSSPSREAHWWRVQGDSPLDERSRVQVDRLLGAFTEAGLPVGAHRGEDGEVDYLYRQGVVLTRDRDAARVHEALGLRYDGEKGERSPVQLAGLHVVLLTDGRDAAEVCDELDRRLGLGVVTPDHVVHVSKVTWCASTEPSTASAPSSFSSNLDPRADGRTSRVVVVDTGLRDDVVADHPELKRVSGEPEPASVGHYAGHGTFIAGVVVAHAPAAEVIVLSGMGIGGATFETDLVGRLDDALELVPDVICLSAGVRTRRELPMLSFEVFWEQRLRHLKGTAFVAAAGNDGDRGPFWPAAFPWAVSVGATEDESGQARAGFTNYGSWVDVYALGTDVVGPYPRQTYTYVEPPQLGDPDADFPDGFATWSGTSFSAPMVAGLVAARLTWSGESGRRAARTLLQRARADAVDGVGAVLLDDRHAQPSS